MKIAIFVHKIGGIGGGQKAISKLADYLQLKGHIVEFFTPFYDKNTAYNEFNKIKVNIMKPKSKLLSPFLFLLKKVKGFDIFLLDDFPSYFAGIRNKPNIMLCYTPKRDFYDLRKYNYQTASFKGKIAIILKNLLFKKLDFFVVQNINSIITLSKHVKKRIEKDYKRIDSKVIYWGIDFSKYKTGKFGNYFLCVSRLVKAKRMDMIVKSMGFVKNKKIKLYIVGGGPEEENIRNLSKKYSNVKFFGEVGDKELINLYSNCFGVVYVPLNEDRGFIHLEAGASGKPVITVNEGGIPEDIEDGKNGILIDDVTPKKIAEKIDYLLANKKIAIKMGKEGRKISKKSDWSYVLPRFEKEILKAIKKE